MPARSRPAVAGQRCSTVATAVLAAVLVAGCAAGEGTGSPGSPRSPSRTPTAPTERGTPSPPPADLDPIGLVGSWRVVARGEDPGAVLQLGDDLELWRRCGLARGAWRVGEDGLFLGHLHGSSRCPPSDPEAHDQTWLARVATFRIEGAGSLLLDRDGQVVARLLPGGRPTPDPLALAELAKPPVLTGRLRARLQQSAAPVPRRFTPALHDRLVGRWVPADGRGSASPRPPFVQLTSDGAWRGSDGCNVQYGRWAAGRGGTLLTVSGPQTEMGCDGAGIGSWLYAAARAGLDGEALVLLDASGAETGRLRRAPAP